MLTPLFSHQIHFNKTNSTDRDDMGGVGSFNRETRTLYIGGIHNLYSDSLPEVLLEQFGEWGEIEERFALSHLLSLISYRSLTRMQQSRSLLNVDSALFGMCGESVPSSRKKL